MNSCKVAIDKVTSFHKGVAYVDFATNEDAKNAVKYMDGGRFLIILFDVSVLDPWQPLVWQHPLVWRHPTWF